MTRTEILNEIKADRQNYYDMIRFCCDTLLLNNDLLSFYNEHCYDMEVFCGSDIDEETEEHKDIFQYFIISENDAERLADYTNEIVYYLPSIDTYLLCVTHCGTMWSGVSANWKDEVAE